MKRFIYKVYDSQGNFLSVLSDVASPPAFTSSINSGVGQLNIRLPRSIFSFQEGTVIALNNEVRLVCFDTEAPKGRVIYSGYISKYAASMENSGKEFISVTCLGYITELQRFVFHSPTIPEETFWAPNLDPGEMVETIIDEFNINGGKVARSLSSVSYVGQTVSYRFNTNTYKETLDKTVSLSPAGWYYYISPDNILTFKAKNSEPDHLLTLGKDVISIVPEKSTENMVNEIYFKGGSDDLPLYKKYVRQSSIDNYGRFAVRKIDGRVTSYDTMDIIAGSILDNGDVPETRTELVVRDSNIARNQPNTSFSRDSRGYDIESIKPGDTIKIQGYGSQAESRWDQAFWDVDKWDYELSNAVSLVQQIQKVSYTPDKVTLEISSKLPDVTRRVEDIKRNLEYEQTRNNPKQPVT